jgi:hypothetical protein
MILENTNIWLGIMIISGISFICLQLVWAILTYKKNKFMDSLTNKELIEVLFK